METQEEVEEFYNTTLWSSKSYFTVPLCIHMHSIPPHLSVVCSCVPFQLLSYKFLPSYTLMVAPSQLFKTMG